MPPRQQSEANQTAILASRHLSLGGLGRTGGINQEPQRKVDSAGEQISESVQLRRFPYVGFFRTRTRTQAHAGTRTRAVCSRIEYEYDSWELPKLDVLFGLL